MSQTEPTLTLQQAIDLVESLPLDDPILLTEESKPGYVIMSAQSYQQLLDRLNNLEDNALGQLAEIALQNSKMVGAETFTAELQRLASLDSGNS